MAHSKTEKNQTYKSYKLKVKNYESGVDIIKGIDEYNTKFNNVSKWIAEHLTSITIGEAASMLPAKILAKDSKYVETSLSDEWKDLPLYKAFSRAFGGMNLDNLIIGCTRYVSGCEFDKEKSLGISESYFRKAGFAIDAVSNMKSRLTSLKVKIKKEAITEDSEDDKKCEQCVYEIQKHGFEKDDDWKNQISYYEMRMDDIASERLSILYKYYKKNREKVIDVFDLMKVKTLQSFSGSERKSNKKTFSLNDIDYTIKRTGSNEFEMDINIGKGCLGKFTLFGHRAIIKNGNVLVDIEKNHSSKIVFILEGDEMYVVVSVKTNCEKSESSFKNVAGVDINTKHALIVTSIQDDGNIKDYINLYKELLKDSSFTESLNKSELHILEDLSKYATFGIIEAPYLGSRVIGFKGEHTKIVEDKLTSSLKRIASELISSGENRKRIYVQNVLKMRAMLKCFIERKNRYSDEQKTYDSIMGFTDKKDERRKTEGFFTTERGKELLEEIDGFAKKIVACRDNIVEYSYYVFGLNGYDTISLENIESATFSDVTQKFPTCKSMLYFHKMEGKTVECAASDKKVGKFIKNGYYIIDEEDGKITGMKYSEIGENERKKQRLYDMIMKSVHFADIKDKFVELSNNGKVCVVISPSYFTSMMDSISHKVFTEEITIIKKSKNGRETTRKKTVLVDKKKVRKSQELHINGLNADYNAARNLKYIAEEENWRDNLCFKTWNTYGLPFYDSTIKSQKTMIDRLSKLGALEELKLA